MQLLTEGSLTCNYATQLNSGVDGDLTASLSKICFCAHFTGSAFHIHLVFNVNVCVSERICIAYYQKILNMLSGLVPWDQERFYQMLENRFGEVQDFG